MSSGEEFEVGEILEQRKQKGVLEYLVRWQGFSDLYDSWEPAAGLAHCKNAIKGFMEKNKRSRSNSRSRSRGRPATKSKSRSRSRGRSPKSGSTPTRSRSRSASRKTTQSSTKTSSHQSTLEVAVTKKEASPAKQERPGRSRSRTRPSEQKPSTSKTEVVSQRASTTQEGGLLERKTEVVTRSVETVKSIPVRMDSATVTTRSRLAVRQVDNDQKPAGPKSAAGGEGKEVWLWWFADHAILILFVLVSLVALSFTIESVSAVRDKLVPDMGVLRQRLGESYEHFVQSVSHSLTTMLEILPTWGDDSAGQKKAATSST